MGFRFRPSVSGGAYRGSKRNECQFARRNLENPRRNRLKPEVRGNAILPHDCAARGLDSGDIARFCPLPREEEVLPVGYIVEIADERGDGQRTRYTGGLAQTQT